MRETGNARASSRPSVSSCAARLAHLRSSARRITIGGRRIDNADTYHNQLPVGVATKWSGVPREQLFVTSKVGSPLPMGHNDTLAQFAGIQAAGGWAHVDLLLIHWFSCAGTPVGPGTCPQSTSTDPPCQFGRPTYNERECRLQTWRALLAIFASGGARAVGVSNFNSTHLQEIADAGLPLPAVNQIPFNIYVSAVRARTVGGPRAR